MRRVAGTIVWPNTRIRRKGMAVRKQIRMRGALKSAALYLAIFLFFAMAYVWTRVQVVETGYRLSHLEKVHVQLAEENQALKVEVATLRSPQRLERYAEDMGLKRPRQEQVKFLKMRLAGEP